MAKTAEQMMAETVARRPKTGTQQRREQEAQAPAMTPKAAAGISLTAQPNTNKETNVTGTAVVSKRKAAPAPTVTPPAPAVVAPADTEIVYSPTGKSLKALEGIIQRGMDAYVKAGNALREIHERKLWGEAVNPETGEAFTSWESYVKVRWEMSKQRASQIMGAATTVGVLVLHGAKYLPGGEFATRQIADLAKTDPEKAVEIVNKAGDESPTGKVTAQNLAAARDEVAPERASAGGAGGASATRSVRLGGSGVVRRSSGGSTGASTRSVTLSPPTTPKSDEERNVASDIKNLDDLCNALREGYLTRGNAEVLARVQRLAGLTITWLASAWVDGKEGHADPLIISQPTAKYIANGLIKERNKARAEREAKQATLNAEADKLDAANKAKINPPAAPVVAAPAPAAEAEAPKTAQAQSDEEWALATLQNPNAGPTHTRIARQILGMPVDGAPVPVAMDAQPEADADEADDEDEVEYDEESLDEDEADEESDEADDEGDDFDFDLDEEEETEEEAPAPAPAPRTSRQTAARRR